MGGYVRLHCDKKTMLTEAITFAKENEQHLKDCMTLNQKTAGYIQTLILREAGER